MGPDAPSWVHESSEQYKLSSVKSTNLNLMTWASYQYWRIVQIHVPTQMLSNFFQEQKPDLLNWKEIWMQKQSGTNSLMLFRKSCCLVHALHFNSIK